MDKELENIKLKEFLYRQTKNIQDKLEREFSGYMDINDLIFIKNKVLNNKETRGILVSKYSDSLDYDMLFNLRLCSKICAIYSLDKAINKDLVLKDNLEYIESLVRETTVSTYITNGLYLNTGVSLFLSHPLVCAILQSSQKLIYEISLENTKKIVEEVHKDYPKLSNLLLYIMDAAKAINSIFQMIDSRAFSQALTVFRNVLEQTITVDTLAHFPNCLDSFFYHVRLKRIEEFEKNKDEVDKYLISKNINPKDMTLRSKYIDYGFLDAIDKFNMEPKKMYRIKTMAKMIDKKEFYEWYSICANYVHSNFIFLNMNWLRIISDLICQITEVTLNLLDLYSWLLGKTFEISNVDAKEYINKLYQKTVDAIHLSNYTYDFGLHLNK